MRLSLRSMLPRSRAVLATALLVAGAASAATLYNFTPVTNAMQAFVTEHTLDGASLRVNKAGSVVYRRAFGGYSLTTRVPIASGSKWLSGLTIARLVDKGTMHWSDTVGQYFPNAPADKKGITLAQLFSHTSALPDTDNLCMANQRITLGDCANTILANSTLIGTPGKVFAYGGNSMQVAGRMAEIATGKSWDDIFIAETVTPLGLTQTDYAYDSTVAGYVRMANPRIAEGGRSTLEDYGHVVDMLLANGRYGSTVFLSRATLDAMSIDRTVGTQNLSRPPYTDGFGYGIGHWIDSANDPNATALVISSPGAFGFTPWVDYGSNVAGVLLVKDQRFKLAPDITDIRAMVNVVTSPTGTLYRAEGLPSQPVADKRAPAPVRATVTRTNDRR
jgi:CubicO group peptidase (beta-lactamase class C family)